MGFAVVYSRASVGIEAPLVTVEAHLSPGLPTFTIVGLPETVVRESRDRVRGAIIRCGFEFPQCKIIVNLAPADLPKSGGRFDLAIAISILAAKGYLEQVPLDDYEFMGELALSGAVRKVKGVLPGLLAASHTGRTCIVPEANEAEAALLEKARIKMCPHLTDLLETLLRKRELPAPSPRPPRQKKQDADFADVVGQSSAKRALVLAAAGGHNLLMRGPPGTGKTMLASRLATILPPLEPFQAMELAAVRSITDSDQDFSNIRQPPFRAPHHTCSAIALTGGGSTLHTGEISLAHHGVLFLDELPEYPSRVLEVLREPMESGEIRIARARYQVRLPARFQLIAAMNVCPCGYYGDDERECRCTPDRIQRYRQRVSGPLMDRIDIQVEVPRLTDEERKLLLQNRKQTECSAQLREQVIFCRRRQYARAGCINAQMEQAQIKQHCALAEAEMALLDAAVKRLKLSNRAYFRILKIARTIADLAAAERISREHLMEAINYRRFDMI